MWPVGSTADQQRRIISASTPEAVANQDWDQVHGINAKARLLRWRRGYSGGG